MYDGIAVEADTELPVQLLIRPVESLDCELLAVGLDYGHGERTEVLAAFKGFLVQAGEVIEVRVADGGEVAALIWVLESYLGSCTVAFQHLLGRDGLAVVEALHLGASGFFQELGLLCGLNTLDNGLYSQCDGHLDQLDDDYPALLLVEVAHEVHVQLDEVEVYLLQEVHG